MGLGFIATKRSLLDLSENWSGSPPEGGFHSSFRMNLLTILSFSIAKLIAAYSVYG